MDGETCAQCQGTGTVKCSCCNEADVACSCNGGDGKCCAQCQADGANVETSEEAPAE